MISLRDVSKAYKTRNGKRVVLDRVSHDFVPGVNTGILGRNGTGKSTLIRLISGGELPDSGTVERNARISWPLGFAGGLNLKMTGRENLRFICRLYNEPYHDVVSFVENFSELGDYMDMPVRTYSSGMNAKLLFGLSMAFSFDYYLIDELTAVGDAVFRKKSQTYFTERSKNATLLVVSHSTAIIRQHCQAALVLHEGQLLNFPTLKESEEYYMRVCCGFTTPNQPQQKA